MVTTTPICVILIVTFKNIIHIKMGARPQNMPHTRNSPLSRTKLMVARSNQWGRVRELYPIPRPGTIPPPGPVPYLTDTCEIITFPQLVLRTVNNS